MKRCTKVHVIERIAAVLASKAQVTRPVRGHYNDARSCFGFAPEYYGRWSGLRLCLNLSKKKNE